MENVEKIIVNFNGFIEVDKNDMKVSTIDTDGNMQPVDTTKLTAKELLDGFRAGVYYLMFAETYQNALDGQESYDFELEDDE